MNQLQLKIVTPDGVVYEDSVLEIVLPSSTGQLAILPNHIPLISRLRAGEITIKKENGEHGIAISTGFLEIRPNNEVYIVADTAERAEHIDIERAQQAHDRAQQLLQQQQNVEDVEFVRIQAQIEKELARLGVARRYKR